jgi:phage shock protein A
VEAALTDMHQCKMDALQRRRSTLAADLASMRRDLEQTIEEIRQQGGMLEAQLSEVQRELEAFESVTFAAYLRRVLLPLRTKQAA